MRRGSSALAAPMKYPPEMYRTVAPMPVIPMMARHLGVHHQAPRNWIHQDEADQDEQDDRLTTRGEEGTGRSTQGQHRLPPAPRDPQGSLGLFPTGIRPDPATY